MTESSIIAKPFLCLVQLNAENLFLFMEEYQGQDLQQMSEEVWQKLSRSSTFNKNLKKTWALANAISEINPDFVLLNEVGGKESLTNFNQHFLNDRYEPLIIEGNSDRGIDVGYLVKKDPDLQCLLISHRKRPLDFLPDNPTPTTQYFSRDALELRVFHKGEGSPRLICLLTHLKSKLDPDGIDPQGRKRRQAELQTLVKIYNDITRETDHQIPILVAGDFNGQAYRQECEPEFADLYTQTDLQELFDLKIQGDHLDTEEDRITQTQFLRDGTRRLLQLDYFFLSPLLVDKILPEGCFVYRYRNEENRVQPISSNMDQRLRLPSDHYPVVLTIANPLQKKDR